MRWPLPLAAFLAAVPLAGCGEVEPPPGDVIGTFSFTATLDTSTRDGRCNFPDTPPTMKFEAVLSYEPATLEDGSRKLWVQILGGSPSTREGRITGTRFIVRSPIDPDTVPRTLDACRLDDDGDGVPDKTRCTLEFAEFLAGDLYSRLPEVPVGRDPCGDAPLAQCTDCGLDPSKLGDAGGVCGDVTEDVVPEAAATACLCTDDAGAVAPAPAACTIVYRLKGEPT